MTTVVMPQLGESVMEGTVVRWIARPGQKVERDEPLVEIATDKANTEIPSPSAGVLVEQLAKEGAGRTCDKAGQGGCARSRNRLPSRISGRLPTTPSRTAMRCACFPSAFPRA